MRSPGGNFWPHVAGRTFWATRLRRTFGARHAASGRRELDARGDRVDGVEHVVGRNNGQEAAAELGLGHSIDSSFMRNRFRSEIVANCRTISRWPGNWVPTASGGSSPTASPKKTVPMIATPSALPS